MLEGELHRRFSQYSAHGEWFSIPEEEISSLFKIIEVKKPKSRAELVADFYYGLVASYSKRARAKLLAQLNVANDEEAIIALIDWQTAA